MDARPAPGSSPAEDIFPVGVSVPYTLPTVTAASTVDAPVVPGPYTPTRRGCLVVDMGRVKPFICHQRKLRILNGAQPNRQYDNPIAHLRTPFGRFEPPSDVVRRLLAALNLVPVPLPCRTF